MSSFWEILIHADATQIKAFAANHLGLTLLLCFVSGILTSFTPCVYPVIPITINIFGRSSGQTPHKGFNFSTFKLALIYVAGLCTTYSALGLVSGLTGSLFGSLLQSSWVLGFLTLLFLALALSQMGLFPLTLPSSLQTWLATKGNPNRPLGIYVMGLLAGLIISPCVGPIVAGILAFVFESSNAWLGGLYFFAFSLGLGVLFLAIGGFSGLIHQLPRSGHWMEKINKLLATLLIVASAYYGFLWMKQLGIFQKSHENVGENTIAWVTEEQAALTLAKKKNLPVMIDFSAEWCAVCHEIDAAVFRNPEVVAQIQKRIIPVRIDVTEDNEKNASLLKKYGILGLPTIVFLKSNGEILERPRISGLISASEYFKLLDAVSPTPSSP